MSLEIIKSLYYSFLDRIYSISSAKPFLCGFLSVVYIGLLLWFTHFDLVCQLLSDDSNVCFTQLLVNKHSFFLTCITNWGLLLMLVIDILISANKSFTLKLATVVNILGSISVIFAFGCALGYKSKQYEEICTPPVCVAFLIAFCMILLYLKYTALIYPYKNQKDGC